MIEFYLKEDLGWCGGWFVGCIEGKGVFVAGNETKAIYIFDKDIKTSFWRIEVRRSSPLSIICMHAETDKNALQPRWHVSTTKKTIYNR
jgi:hypothetical protein